MIDDPLEAGGLVLGGDAGLADLLQHSVAHLLLPLDAGLLAHHLVLVVTFLHKTGLTSPCSTIHHGLNVSLNVTALQADKISNLWSRSRAII